MVCGASAVVHASAASCTLMSVQGTRRLTEVLSNTGSCIEALKAILSLPPVSYTHLTLPTKA